VHHKHLDLERSDQHDPAVGHRWSPKVSLDGEPHETGGEAFCRAS
jgi:hypothetical protein